MTILDRAGYVAELEQPALVGALPRDRLDRIEAATSRVRQPGDWLPQFGRPCGRVTARGSRVEH